MHIGLVSTAARIHWLVKAEDPAIQSLEPFASWAVINPCYLAGDSFHKFYEWHHFTETQSFIHITSKNSFVKLNTRENINGFADEFETFLRRLRHVTKQATMPSSVVQISLIESELPEIPDEETGRQSVSFVKEHTIDTAVTFEAIRQAASLGENFSPSVYDTLMIDAIEALLRSDFRTCIMFAAMAVETMAGYTVRPPTPLCSVPHRIRYEQ